MEHDTATPSVTGYSGIHVMVLGLRGFPDVQGGVERHAERLYPLIAQSGCRVDVIARAPYIPRGQRQWKGVTFHRLWAPRLPGAEALLHSLIGVVYAGIRRPDVLHIHAIGPAIVTPLARAMGLKVVVTHHGPDYDREKWGTFARRLLRLGERWGMSWANRRIVITEVIRRLVLERYRLDADVIPNGAALPEMPHTTAALDRFALTAGRYILLVSRFAPEKRHLDLIEAFARAGLTDWKLVLVGDANDRTGYSRKVRAAAERVPGTVIAGFQSGTALAELYMHAGMFVLPSSHEGLPIALLEALSYGLPVLASDILANLDLGLSSEHYFPLGNVPALAAAMRRLSETELDPLQRRERQAWVAARYHWPAIAARTLEIYRQLAYGQSATADIAEADTVSTMEPQQRSSD
jgi:glycosyltransferase involved in cell wall biosynthesis